jgi:hypothetical protein
LYWSREGSYFGFNEQSAATQDRRRFSVVSTERQELEEVAILMPDADVPLQNFRVSPPESLARRSWVSAGVVVLWIHGDYAEITMQPQWGYEVAVNLAADGGA